MDSIINLTPGRVIYYILLMCYCPCRCCCCAPPFPPQIIYAPATTADTDWMMRQQSGEKLPKPPPANDEIWHHGYTFCNCQECCDFRNCCDCSGFCYGCNVGANSIPFFNSPYGPLYEYYQAGCCRSCFAAQFSGVSCMGSLMPCCLNNLYVVDESKLQEFEMTRNKVVKTNMSSSVIHVGTPTAIIKPQIITVRTGQPLILPTVQQVPRPPIPQIIPTNTQPIVFQTTPRAYRI